MQVSYFHDVSMFSHYPYHEQSENDHQYNNMNYDQLSLDSSVGGSGGFNQLQTYQTYSNNSGAGQVDYNNHETQYQGYFVETFNSQMNYSNLHPSTFQSSAICENLTSATTTPLTEFPIDTSAFDKYEEEFVPVSNTQNDDNGFASFQLNKKVNDFDQFPTISTEYSSESCSISKTASSSSSCQPLLSSCTQQNDINSYFITSAPTTSFNSPLSTPLASPTSTQFSRLNHPLKSPTSPRKSRPATTATSSISSRRSSITSNKVCKTYREKSASLSSPSSHSHTSHHFHHSLQHTTQPGPIPASKPQLTTDLTTGEELLTFSYSKQKIIRNFTIKCPPPNPSEALSELSQQFLLENCVYPRAMCSFEDYKGNRYQYEKECNEIGWSLASLNPEIRDHRGLIQRAVDSWRNTRKDKKLRSRRVRKSELR